MYMLFDGGRPGLKTQLLSKYVRQLHLIKDEETFANAPKLKVAL